MLKKDAFLRGCWGEGGGGVGVAWAFVEFIWPPCSPFGWL